MTSWTVDGRELATVERRLAPGGAPMVLDRWDDGLVDDSPPWVGLAALAVGAAAVTAGVLGTAALIAGGTWLKRWARR